MDQLSYGAIYILILTVIGSYYFVRYYVIKCGFILIRWIIPAPIIIPYESIRDFFKNCKKKKRIAKYATPTQLIIIIICEWVWGACIVGFCIIMIATYL